MANNTTKTDFEKAQEKAQAAAAKIPVVNKTAERIRQNQQQLEKLSEQLGYTKR